MSIEDGFVRGSRNNPGGSRRRSRALPEQEKGFYEEADQPEEGYLDEDYPEESYTDAGYSEAEYLDEDFRKVTEEFDKFACRMVQHELDHLDGRMFVDRVAPIRRKMIARKLASISHGKVSARYKTKID